MAGMSTLTIRGALRRPTVPSLSFPACGIASATLAAALLLAPLAGQAAPQAQNTPAVPAQSSVSVPSAIAADPLPAAPTSVVLYPRSARVTVEDRVSVEAAPGGGQAFQVALPAGADPATLSVTIPGNGVASVSIREADATESSRVVRLRAELAGLRREAASVAGSIAATEARMTLWSKPPVTNAPTADLERLDAQMARRLAELNATLPDLRDKEAVLAARIDRLERELNEAGGAARTAPVATVLLASPARGPLAVSYVYTLRDAGWRPAYRLEAFPDKGSVGFTFEAQIRQGGSVDWNGARLSVATVEPGTALQPPPLRDWQLRPILGVTPMAMKAAPAPVAAESMALRADAAPSAPSMDEKATYEVWDLGPRTLPAGGSARVALRGETWPATFRHTVRPAADPRAFLTASVTLPEPRHYPTGEALYVADGASVGSATFSLAEDKADIFFGSDPMVSATMRLDERKSGREGLVNKQQTRTWAWTIEVANRRATPVSVRVEDPEPQPRDTAISLGVESDPKPATENQKLVWTLDVAPRAAATIRHTVRATAPADMRLDDGR
ncbi:MAG: DUF4139 domain-containing protein [Desulfovibrio sp.]|jgi:uncharacterized protein (TIGR02231 family)|nr:DUF4139 domain-containing protein [Desulfovibrio sp.]